MSSNSKVEEFILLPPEIAQQAAGGAKAPAGPSVADEKAALKEKGLYFSQGSGPDLNQLDDAWLSSSDERGFVVVGLEGLDGLFSERGFL